MNKWLVSLSLAGFLVSPMVHAAGDATAGQQKSAVCAGCHAADGNSVNPIWPKLAGLAPAYIVKQLNEYKSGARQDPVMAPMAMPLSEQDMEDLAAYFSTQQRQGGEADPAKVAVGETIYRGGNSAAGVSACAACHAPNGVGNPAAGFPALAGQHAAYTEKTLKDFRAGARNNDMAQMMQDIAGRMTDAEIAAVSQYVQGLR